MNTVTQLGISAADSFSKLINESADVIFNIVPVMMYTVDEEGVILKVNPRWLSAMGYEIQEVVGQRFIGFLTEECRIQSLSDTLPLFWESGRVHSSSYRLRRKDARVLYVALDAVVTQEPLGELGTIEVFAKLTTWFNGNGRKTLSRLSKALNQLNTAWKEFSRHPKVIRLQGKPYLSSLIILEDDPTYLDPSGTCHRNYRRACETSRIPWLFWRTWPRTIQPAPRAIPTH